MFDSPQKKKKNCLLVIFHCKKGHGLVSTHPRLGMCVGIVGIVNPKSAIFGHYPLVN